MSRLGINGPGRKGESWCRRWLPGFWLEYLVGWWLPFTEIRSMGGCVGSGRKIMSFVLDLLSLCVCETWKWGCEWAAGYMGLELRNNVWN